MSDEGKKEELDPIVVLQHLAESRLTALKVIAKRRHQNSRRLTKVLIEQMPSMTDQAAMYMADALAPTMIDNACTVETFVESLKPHNYLAENIRAINRHLFDSDFARLKTELHSAATNLVDDLIEAWRFLGVAFSLSHATNPTPAPENFVSVEPTLKEITPVLVQCHDICEKLAVFLATHLSKNQEFIDQLKERIHEVRSKVRSHALEDQPTEHASPPPSESAP